MWNPTEVRSWVSYSQFRSVHVIALLYTTAASCPWESDEPRTEGLVLLSWVWSGFSFFLVWWTGPSNTNPRTLSHVSLRNPTLCILGFCSWLSIMECTQQLVGGTPVLACCQWCHMAWLWHASLHSTCICKAYSFQFQAGKVFPCVYRGTSCLNLSNAFNAAVWVVASIAFWLCCWLGELLIPSQNLFNPTKHVTCIVIPLSVSGNHPTFHTLK